MNLDNTVLYQKATEWDFAVDGSPLDLITEMTRTMFQHNGVGLAGPQLGVSKRIFVMGNEDFLLACINPKILLTEGEVLEQEGCLSFPNLWLRVKRFKDVRVEYQDVEGKMIEQQFTGLISRVFQHELEHLDGICFTSKVSRLALDLAKKRQKKASKK